jgi:polyhydroxyalkanoate synthase
MLAASSYLSLPVGLALWREGLLPLNTPYTPHQNLVPDAVQFGVTQFNYFLQGIAKYQNAPRQHPLIAAPCLLQIGGTKLLDYGVFSDADHPQPLLIIPSLVNRANILDLSEERSFLRYLAAQGFRPLLIDWGELQSSEHAFTLTDYITKRLEPLLQHAVTLTQNPVTVLGYCMGGLLALAAAQRAPQSISKLVLLATPWDFTHAIRPDQRTSIPLLQPFLRMLRQKNLPFPVDMLQTLFASIDLFAVPERYIAFAKDGDAQRNTQFIAVEDWLNDGVAVSAAVAEECLLGWYQHNTPHNNAWQVGDDFVAPHNISLPTLIVTPKHDKIVPPAAALGLRNTLPYAAVIQPNTGHIGMVVGRKSTLEMWKPVCSFLQET